MFLPKALTALTAVDSSLKLLSLILTGIIFLKAYSLYKLYREEHLRYFTLAFFFFAFGNLISFTIDMIIYFGLRSTGLLHELVQLHQSIIVFLIFRYGILLIGFLCLFMVALGLPNRKTQFAILLLTIVAGYLSSFKSLYFHVVVSIFTFFILIDLYSKYRVTKKRPQLLYFLGMLTLYLAYLSYVLFLLFNGFYWLGHLLEIISYGLFIASLFTILKKNETKKRTS